MTAGPAPGGAGPAVGSTEGPGIADGPVIDDAVLRRVFGAFPTGVTALAALDGADPLGIAANSFASVSLDPPLVSVCVAHSSTTWPRLRDLARLGVSVLGEHQEAVSRQLAAPAGDRFTGLAWRATDAGAVLLTEAAAWLECSVADTVTAGDHDVVILRVHDLGADPDRPPLVFHGSRYTRLAD